MAHHHLGLAYADYFAAGCSDDGGASVVVPEVDADHRHHIYGVHQPGAEAFVPTEMAAHGKAALGGHDFVGDLGEHALHRRQGNHAATTLMSLSLHGPAAAASSLAVHQYQHHQHQLGGGAHRHHAWPQPQQGAWHLMRGSRFLLPTQQLLQEFCSIPMEVVASNKLPQTKNPANEDCSGGGGSSSAAPSARIQAMDAAELQRLKAKLYTMLDEVDRRYRRYREQMRAVAESFEAVAGAQAAAAYTRLASRTISRHFRALRDGVATQVEAVRMALGEKDAAGVPRVGVAKGETTPRLRVLDQCLRQNRAYQGGVLESQPWRPQRGLPERAVSILRAWLFEHFLHPYPSDVDKHILARQTGLSRSQVSNWFINARVRLWKPMVEEMYAAEEMKGPAEDGDRSNENSSNPNPGYKPEGQGRGGARGDEDGGGGGEWKPTPAQLVVHDAGSLASVVSIGSSSRDQQQNLNFGGMDHLGFGAYDDHAEADGQGFGGGSGVSLTLGLQQHSDPYSGVNVAFAAAAPSSSAHEFLFMAGGGEQQMVAGGGVYSGVHHLGGSAEGDTGVTASKTEYHRDLSATTDGFHLLHDLAG